MGGYLAYIGFFCGQAGLALMAQVQIVSLADWHQLLDPTALMLVAPGVVLGVGLFRVLRTVRCESKLGSCTVTCDSPKMFHWCMHLESYL